MMAHSDDTRDMPEMEFVGNLALLIVGGNDTTRNSMSGGLLALSGEPRRAREAQGQSQHSCRASSPRPSATRHRVIHMRRTATRDVELAGQAHPAR